MIERHYGVLLNGAADRIADRLDAFAEARDQASDDWA
jgi:hypothetical protein